MADYKLKPGQEQFQVVDGPYEGRRYQPDMVYQDIPPEEAHRFDLVETEAATAAPAPTRKTKADAAASVATDAEEAKQ